MFDILTLLQCLLKIYDRITNIQNAATLAKSKNTASVGKFRNERTSTANNYYTTTNIS
jgi:hypothetical protein